MADKQAVANQAPIEEELREAADRDFWHADWGFVAIVAMMSAGVFAGTSMYFNYGVGAFNEVAIVAMLKAGMTGGSYGAAAAFGASFLFARILEGSLVGILDLGGSILTGDRDSGDLTVGWRQVAGVKLCLGVVNWGDFGLNHRDDHFPGAEVHD